MDRFSSPIVEAAAVGGAAAQKLPNPCVGWTAVVSGSVAASLRTEACCAAASLRACSAPSRSGRPAEPCSSDPPVNTATTAPVTALASAYDKWVNV